jgi:hypothetical protein
MDLAEVVIDPGHLQPVAFRVDHSPPGQVVDGGAPEHSLLATGVHSDIAANTRGFRGGGVDSKYELGALGSIAHALGDHARSCEDGRHGSQFPR